MEEEMLRQNTIERVNHNGVIATMDTSKIKVEWGDSELIDDILNLQMNYFVSILNSNVESFLTHLHPEFCGCHFNTPDLISTNNLGLKLESILAGSEGKEKLIHMTPVYYNIEEKMVSIFVSPKLFLYETEENKRIFARFVGLYTWVKEDSDFQLMNAVVEWLQ